jgi:hypothetical protein
MGEVTEKILSSLKNFLFEEDGDEDVPHENLSKPYDPLCPSNVVGNQEGAKESSDDRVENKNGLLDEYYDFYIQPPLDILNYLANWLMYFLKYDTTKPQFDLDKWILISVFLDLSIVIILWNILSDLLQPSLDVIWLMALLGLFIELIVVPVLFAIHGDIQKSIQYTSYIFLITVISIIAYVVIEFIINNITVIIQTIITAVEWAVGIAVVFILVLAYGSGNANGNTKTNYYSNQGRSYYRDRYYYRERTPSDDSRYISSEVKRIVWERDGGRCVICGSMHHLEYDHDIPVCQGGSNTENNIRLLCMHCNRRKSGKIE